MFSVVYQDFTKYYIGMKDNIPLGNIHTKGKEVEEAHLVGLDEAINKLKNGINTPLNKIMKGGQWQCVAIARSLTLGNI